MVVWWALPAECSAALPAGESPRKDAAEEVGEGNAARWLEYYRRERGQSWSRPPERDHDEHRAQPQQPSPKPGENQQPPPAVEDAK
jgi:hypothetical protein